MAEALAMQRSAIVSEPDRAALWQSLGILSQIGGRTEEAIGHYRRVIRLDPDHTEALNNLANALSDQGLGNEPLALLRRSIAVRADYAEAYYNQGLILSRLGRTEDSIAAFERTILLKPRFIEAHNNLGTMLERLGRLAEAEACYRHALSIDPGFVDPLFNIGNLRMGEGQALAAARFMRQVIVLDPSYVAAYNNLGSMLLAEERERAALLLFRRASRLNPFYLESWANQAVVLVELGEIEAARFALSKALLSAPASPALHYALADIKRFAPDDPQIAVMEELTAREREFGEEDRVKLHFGLGKAYDDIGDFKKAFASFKRGNALKRRQAFYDEAGTFDEFRRIAATFTRDAMDRLAGAGHETERPIFIIGMPRSGSTLVEQILASHPEVTAGGERRDMDAAINAALAGRQTEFPEILPDLSPADLNAVATRYLALSAWRGGRFLTDKLPSNYRFAGLIALAMPRAAIIHTRRDPRDTCLSCYTKLFNDQQGQTYDLEELGRFWKAYDALMAHWAEVLPAGRILDVSYEALVEDPEGEARRILEHCRLDWHDDCLEFWKTRRAVRTASAAQVRKPVYKDSIGRWRAYEADLKPLLDILDL